VGQVNCYGADTVGVWSSNPYAPTILSSYFVTLVPPIVHGTVWQTFGRLSKFEENLRVFGSPFRLTNLPSLPDPFSADFRTLRS
jgi:hypothetical protein